MSLYIFFIHSTFLLRDDVGFDLLNKMPLKTGEKIPSVKNKHDL